MFKGDGFLDSEDIIRDKRYTKAQIISLLEKQKFHVIEARYVRAGQFEKVLTSTDKNAKEILVLSKL